MALEPGTMEPSCVIASGGIGGDGRLTVSHAHGSAKTLYKTFVCFKMGSVCERVRLILTRLLAPYRMF